MGKASVAMGKAVEGILGDRISEGWINTKYGHGAVLQRIHVHECGHPVPDEAGVRGAEAIMEFAERADARTLVLCLISGGGSALSPAPAEGMTLREKQETTRLLLGCGATIHELNAIRKHLSRIKGGRLARLAAPARGIALVMSDVVGDSLDVIASGPMKADSSSFEECLEIVRKYGLGARISEAVQRRLEAGAHGEIEETPREGDPALCGVRHQIVGSNREAISAARDQAKALGYHTLMLSSQIEGETKEVAKVHAGIAKEIAASGNPIPRPACVLSGGETTVTVLGDGKGGRNQEFALAGAMAIEGMRDVVLFSAGTDGTDGPTDAAGGMVDGGTVARAFRMGLEARNFLERNDSYAFLEHVGDLMVTGPTGTNVMDVRLVLVGGE
jgi:glycerate-2-kinase